MKASRPLLSVTFLWVWQGVLLYIISLFVCFLEPGIMGLETATCSIKEKKKIFIEALRRQSSGIHGPSKQLFLLSLCNCFLGQSFLILHLSELDPWEWQLTVNIITFYTSLFLKWEVWRQNYIIFCYISALSTILPQSQGLLANPECLTIISKKSLHLAWHPPP